MGETYTHPSFCTCTQDAYVIVLECLCYDSAHLHNIRKCIYQHEYYVIRAYICIIQDTFWTTGGVTMQQYVYIILITMQTARFYKYSTHKNVDERNGIFFFLLQTKQHIIKYQVIRSPYKLGSRDVRRVLIIQSVALDTSYTPQSYDVSVVPVGVKNRYIELLRAGRIYRNTIFVKVNKPDLFKLGLFDGWSTGFSINHLICTLGKSS